MRGGVESYREWVRANDQARWPLTYNEYLDMLEIMGNACKALGGSRGLQPLEPPAGYEVSEASWVQDPEGQEDSERDYLERILNAALEVVPE